MTRGFGPWGINRVESLCESSPLCSHRGPCNEGAWVRRVVTPLALMRGGCAGSGGGEGHLVFGLRFSEAVAFMLPVALQVNVAIGALIALLLRVQTSPVAEEAENGNTDRSADEKAPEHSHVFGVAGLFSLRGEGADEAQDGKEESQHFLLGFLC